MVDAGTIFHTKRDAVRWTEERSSTPKADFIIKKQKMTIRGITEFIYLVLPNRKGPMFGNPFA